MRRGVPAPLAHNRISDLSKQSGASRLMTSTHATLNGHFEICSWHREVIRDIRKGERPTAGTASRELKEAGFIKCIQNEIGADGHQGRWIVTDAGNVVFRSRKVSNERSDAIPRV